MKQRARCSPFVGRQTPLVTAALIAGVSLVAVAAGEQAPAFRSAVDLIAIDVQVVDDEGRPVGTLNPEDFEVEISGHRRRVVSADLIRSAPLDGSPIAEAGTAAGAAASNIWPSGSAEMSGRLYILAFDVGSLTAADSREIVGPALQFIDRLVQSDRIGLYTFPHGQYLEPTTDHAAVRRQMSAVAGRATGLRSQFHLSTSEIVDINVESSRLPYVRHDGPSGEDLSASSNGTTIQQFTNEARTIGAVQARECGAGRFQCVGAIQGEARALGFYLEERATQALDGMRKLISSLADYPGRKTVIVFSAGIPLSDRPGVQPNIGGLPKAVGRSAAVTNSTIYTLLVENTGSRAMARVLSGTLTRGRDIALASRALRELSEASGGVVSRVRTGSGAPALDRVLRETSSHYLLGIQPEPEDRDGKLRKLGVEVRLDDVTVRSREWVVVPERGKS